MSAFWGNAFGSSIWDNSSAPASSIADLRLAVPMPQVASEILADVTEGLADRSLLPEDLKPQHNVQSTMSIQSSVNHDDEAFMIKSGRKRKAREAEPGLADSGETTAEYDISLNEQDEETARAKAARKAERKERKRAKKAAKRLSSEANTEFESEEQEEEEPFDYSKAESVLHRKAKETDGRGSKGKKPFDPYAKSADAPKGMRKLQTERTGKSSTFKS
jgi:exosome complex exonuclease RRP6